MDRADIRNRFEYHPANTSDRQADHTNVRNQLMETAFLVDSVCPEGREKSLAVTKLEEAMFWANAAIARQP
jgi:exoribonuclease R